VTKHKAKLSGRFVTRPFFNLSYIFKIRTFFYKKTDSIVFQVAIFQGLGDRNYFDIR
jgi:hypothetical protein